MRALAGMGLLSAASLLLQVSLTRVFSIAQFYHFAFLIVSLALLGFGASGSLLTVWPRFRDCALQPWHALGFAMATVMAYLFANHCAFDSYSIAWDRDQAYLLVGNLLALGVPFVFAGALVGSMVSGDPAFAGRTYSANLLGSAFGAAAAPVVIAWLGSERAILLCAVLGAISALMLSGSRRGVLAASASCLLGGIVLLVMFPPAFEIRPSPYKRLSRLRLNPDAEIIATHRNAHSRVDIVRSPTIHSAPGLSLAYIGQLPPQCALLIDGDDLLPVFQASNAPSELAGYLPPAVAHALRPGGDVLVLGSGGGMDAWVALRNGMRSVEVVEPNELVYKALLGELRSWAGLADDPRVELVRDELRAFANRANVHFDVVQLTLTDNYRPIASGAFTLTEDYALTVEAVRSYLGLCGDDGLLVVTRWLQSPPSESLRMLGLIIEALDSEEPVRHIVAFRSFQTMTFLVKPTAITRVEAERALAMIRRLRYDLVLAPQMPSSMVNRYARLASPVYHELFLALATAPDRQAFYDAYDYDISPPTDDHPFFFHFFRWRQTPEILQYLGRRWQPFGGSGYLVLIALLVFAVAGALIFVVAPIIIRKQFRRALRRAGRERAVRSLGYFAMIGLAYLLLEVALIQRYMLVLSHPALAMATVIGALLLFSALGSSKAHRLPWRPCMFAIAVLVAFHPWVSGQLVLRLLSAPLGVRVVATTVAIAPVGALMGVPFARGVLALSDAEDLIPWAWAMNGGASVVSGVLAAVLALSCGLTVVMLVGAGLYVLAAVVATPRG